MSSRTILPSRVFGSVAAAMIVAAAIGLSTGHAVGADRDPVRLFGTSEKANHDLSQFPKWTEALRRYERERPLEAAPCRGPCPLQLWKAFVAGQRGKSALEQLRAINRYVNQTPYQADQSRFGAVDHWATPAEFLGRSGDCEDYAIAKYLSLRNLGWDEGSLRILVLNDENRRELHAVLIAYHGGTAYVLDNQVPDVLEHGSIRHYRPIFSINAGAWFFHEGWPPNAPAVASQAPAPSRAVLTGPALAAVPLAEAGVR